MPTLYQDYDDDDLYAERTVTRSMSQLYAGDISTKSDISTVTRSMSQLHAAEISTKSDILMLQILAQIRTLERKILAIQNKKVVNGSFKMQNSNDVGKLVLEKVNEIISLVGEFSTPILMTNDVKQVVMSVDALRVKLNDFGKHNHLNKTISS